MTNATVESLEIASLFCYKTGEMLRDSLTEAEFASALDADCSQGLFFSEEFNCTVFAA